MTNEPEVQAQETPVQPTPKKLFKAPQRKGEGHSGGGPEQDEIAKNIIRTAHNARQQLAIATMAGFTSDYIFALLTTEGEEYNEDVIKAAGQYSLRASTTFAEESYAVKFNKSGGATVPAKPPEAGADF